MAGIKMKGWNDVAVSKNNDKYYFKHSFPLNNLEFKIGLLQVQIRLLHQIAVGKNCILPVHLQKTGK
jgi:hypothetical protein